MTDIHRAFRDHMRRTEQDLFFGSTTSTASDPEPLTLEKLREVRRSLGKAPPPPTVRVTRAAAMLPDAEPHTDDMRDMVERVGRQRVPACLHLKTMFGEMYAVHPDLLPTPTDTPEGDK